MRPAAALPCTLALAAVLGLPGARADAPGALAVSIEWFDTPAEAFGPLLSRKPRVLALGEYHQTHQTAKVRSSLRRFIDDVLPHLLYWPTDLIVETWVPAGDCGAQKSEAVTRDVQRTTQRPKATESEIITLLRSARERGIQPHILDIACSDYQSLMGEDGQVDYDRLLTLLTRQILRKVHEVRARRDDPVRPILVYGGGLHNDLQPREEFRRYTFGPQLLQDLGGRYLEVDLYVPEYVEKDREIAQQDWYRRYLQDLQPKRTALIRRGPNSYVVMFARGR